MSHLEVFSERGFVVASRQRDLKYSALGGESRQTYETSLTAATDPHTQAVSLRHAKYPVNAGEVVQSEVE